MEAVLNMSQSAGLSVDEASIHRRVVRDADTGRAIGQVPAVMPGSSTEQDALARIDEVRDEREHEHARTQEERRRAARRYWRSADPRRHA